MNKTTFIFFLSLLVFIPSIVCAATIFTEGFEGAFPGSWIVGDSNSSAGSDYWDDVSYRAHAGSWSGWCADIGDNSVYGGTNYSNHKYDVYMDSYMYRSVSLGSYNSATLSYYYWLDSESCCDKLSVSYYKSGTWYFIDEHKGNSGGWQSSSVSIPTAATNVGFQFYSDYSVVKEGAYLDDINLTACQCTSGACCDGCNYKSSGSQPTDYTDYYDCNGTNSPTATNYVRLNDYYCNGTDASAHLSQTNVDTCGYCKMCVSGNSTCSNYDSLTVCGTGRCCSGSCDTSFSCSLTSGCYSQTCSGTSWTCAAANQGAACGSDLGPACRYTNTCDAWYYKNTCSSGYCAGAITWTTDAADNSACNDQTCATGKVCQSGSCITPCDSTSYVSCPSTAYDFGTSGGTKSDMCGTDQYYKVTISAGQVCDLTWTLSPGLGDYDLYAKWSSGSCPSTASYDCRSINGGTTADTCTISGLAAGTYYALSHQYSAGRYSATASLTNCQSACSSMSYPTDKWQRVWYDINGNCLGNGPDEPNGNFENDWGSGVVAYGLSDNIMFVSSRKNTITTAGSYSFDLCSDDGSKLYIDGVLVIDLWSDHGYQCSLVNRYLTAGEHTYEIHYYERTASAKIGFVAVPDVSQADCNNECLNRGYPSGSCGPAILYTPSCSPYGYNDEIGDVNTCSGLMMNCFCCHSCSSPPGDTVSVGSCSVTVTGKGWDDTDGSSVGFHWFEKGSNWRSYWMCDNPSSSCADNLQFKTSWPSISGDQITLRTDVLDKSAANNLGAGFTFSGGTCKYTVSLVGTTESSANIIGDELGACESGTHTFGMVRDANVGNYLTWLLDMEYCGDGETNCGEFCDASNPSDPNRTNCKSDCTGINDTTPPTVDIRIFDSANIDVTDVKLWLKADNYTIKFKAKDDASGLDSYEYYIYKCPSGSCDYSNPVDHVTGFYTGEKGIWVTKEHLMGAGNTPKKYNLEGPGAYLVRFFATDKATNTAFKDRGVSFDFTLPTTEIR